MLRIGSRFDLLPVLQKAGDFLRSNMHQLQPASSSSSSTSTNNKNLCIWKWLLLADELRLSSSLPALINRAVEIDREGCKDTANTPGQGLKDKSISNSPQAMPCTAHSSGCETGSMTVDVKHDCLRQTGC